MSLPLVYLALAPQLVEELEFAAQLPRLEGVARVEHWNGVDRPDAALIEDILRRAKVVITGWGTPSLAPLNDWSAEAFEVGLIMHSAGTIKHLVPFTAMERGLLVSSANSSLAEAVAEFTLGAIVLGRRQIFASAARLRAGNGHVSSYECFEVRGSTIGIIGASAIGRRVLRLLAPLGATLLLSDPYCPPEDAAALGAELVSLPELMRRSDIVSLHAPVTKETLGMLGAADFSAMKDGALFINTARGRLIDPGALLRELQTGRISALLDVTDPQEPLPPDSPFFALENCTVLPHIAGISRQARQRQGRISIDETLRFLTGEPLQYRIQPERWETMA
jgi:phosphoglycerate dehydrogenase-like enzyme